MIKSRTTVFVLGVLLCGALFTSSVEAEKEENFYEIPRSHLSSEEPDYVELLESASAVTKGDHKTPKNFSPKLLQNTSSQQVTYSKIDFGASRFFAKNTADKQPSGNFPEWENSLFLQVKKKKFWKRLFSREENVKLLKRSDLKACLDNIYTASEILDARMFPPPPAFLPPSPPTTSDNRDFIVYENYSPVYEEISVEPIYENALGVARATKSPHMSKIKTVDMQEETGAVLYPLSRKKWNPYLYHHYRKWLLVLQRIFNTSPQLLIWMRYTLR